MDIDDETTPDDDLSPGEKIERLRRLLATANRDRAVAELTSVVLVLAGVVCWLLRR